MTRKVRRSQPVAECRWSVPEFRVMSDDDHAFEGYWACERTGVAVPVRQADCSRCRHWSREEVPVRARRRVRAGRH
jgi:hypothetical protein